MNRFRKKSNVKRSELPDIRVPPPHLLSEPLPSLPPASDFRTSLILPDLTRRFSVLRSTSGSPIALDDLKSKFAEQRARGAENSVTEEEEDMILEALGRLHVRTARARGSSVGEEEGEGDDQVHADSVDEGQESSRMSAAPSVATRRSGRSSTTPTSPALHNQPSIASISSAKGSQVSRRMSNNLFGSGKLRDHTYIRSAHHTRRSGSARGTSSIAASESTMSMSTIASSRAGHNMSMYSDSQSLRPGTPEGSVYTQSGSVPSSPNERDRRGRSSSVDSQTESSVETRALGTRLSRTLPPEILHRASMALDEVIRELEEEGDDEIVMERSPIAHAPATSFNGAIMTNLSSDTESGSSLPSPAEYEAGTALSSDDQIVYDEEQRTSPYPRSRTTSPTPRLPGYIPGMPRPMTPHESSFDADDLTPSATPRATSPRLPGVGGQVSPLISQSLASAMYRSNSSSSTSRHTPRPISPVVSTSPTAPLFFNRSPNGRFTPEDRSRNGTASPTTELLDSPTIGRRRPTSPLSGVIYQPLAPSGSTSNSRPSTPSNVTWNIPTSPTSITSPMSQTHNGSANGHSRDDSSAGATEARGGSGADALERSKSQTRSLRSPALPDSPLLDNNHNAFVAFSEYRSPSAMSGDLDASADSSRPLRSPTPTYSTRSPTSSTFPEHAHTHSSSISTNGDGPVNFSRRSSKQNQHSSGFSLGSTHALLLSPIANSSRSSLESAGSSYHSWDEDHRRDRLFALFSNLDPQHSEWHDIPGTDNSTTSTPGTSPYEGLDIEENVKRQTGLTKSDFVAIQDKLVGAALTKAATPDGRNRAPSIRRRRPSTSQSNYSYNGQDSRANGSTPQPQSPTTSAPRPANSDHIAKANALLDSVVDSIKSPSNIPPTASPENPVIVDSPTDTELSSPSRRHRALADALFGDEDRAQAATPMQTSLAPAALMVSKSQEHLSDARIEAPSITVDAAPKRSQSMRGKSMSPGKSPSVPHTSFADNSQLALDVRRRAEEATAALRKSPSIPKFGDSGPRRKISPNQISTPKLVSASTSVDTIPLPATSTLLGQSQGPSSKFSSRFKKFRGTLRARVPPSGDEIHPYPLTLGTPPSVQSVTFSNLGTPAHVEPSLLSAPDAGQFKVPALPLPSPPNTAAPGLKGLMARFRKQRGTDVYPSPQRRNAPSSATSAGSSSIGSGSSPPYDRGFNQQSSSAPPSKVEFRSPSPAVSRVPPPQTPTPRPNTTESVKSAANSQTDQNAMVQQLYDAASNLGIPQAALNDLLSRSPSASSRATAWTNLTRMTSMTDSRKSGAMSPEQRPSMDTSSPRPSTDSRHMPTIPSSSRPSTESRQIPTIRPPPEEPRAREHKGEPGSKAILRRTIIFPNDSHTSMADLNMLMRKQSAARRRRSASAASIHSTRSIQDRVPTPPPPHRSVAGRRFSTDVSPPVPQLPTSFSTQTDSTLVPPPGQMEKSSSTYDSLYEMYAEDMPPSTDSQGQGSATAVQPSKDGIPESGPALEVIELANGETIWSIVNGLRDDDGESFYGDRASFISEYSMKEPNSDGVKLFFKEHERKSSKGSTSSFLSRKKQFKGSNRPETKVFFSSSAQIGRLIENLSRGMDAGSFNITPDSLPQRSGHSASSSMGSEAEMRWTVEERLEQMLGSMGATSR